MFKKTLAFCPGYPNLYQYLQYVISSTLLSASFTWESPRATCITKAETKPCLNCNNCKLDNFVGSLNKNFTNYLLYSHSSKTNNTHLDNTFYK